MIIVRGSDDRHSRDNGQRQFDKGDKFPPTDD
jgi:hypothetical protein